jgi:hypothetical protein
MTIKDDLQAATAKAGGAAQILHDVAHGPATGAASTVVTGNGPVKTVAKVVADIEADITSRIGSIDGAIASSAADAVAAALSATHAQASELAAAASASAAQVAKVTWKGPWSAAAAYAVHDAVSLNGSSYVAIAQNTNQSPPDAATTSVAAIRAGVDVSSRVAKIGDTMTGSLTAPGFTTSGSSATATGFKIASGTDLANIFARQLSLGGSLSGNLTNGVLTLSGGYCSYCSYCTCACSDCSC